MSSTWETAPGGSRSSLDQTKTSPAQSVNINMAPSLQMSPPQNSSPLHQRKDDHAHRKRNRIVVWFVVEDPY